MCLCLCCLPPGIVYVIDSGFHKIRGYNPKTGVESLVVRVCVCVTLAVTHTLLPHTHTHTHSNIQIDVNCNNPLGIRNSLLLKCYSDVDIRFRQLGCVCVCARVRVCV